MSQLEKSDRECLERIKDKYDDLLKIAGETQGIRPEVLAGIMLRESRGGETLTVIPHRPEKQSVSSAERQIASLSAGGRRLAMTS